MPCQRFHLSYVILIATSHLFISGAAIACPSGTTRIDGSTRSWCVRWYANGATFCNAVKTCRANGEEMIDKEVFDAMRAESSLFGDMFWWVGLTDALKEMGTSKTGWVWLNTRQELTAADDYFYSAEPNDRTHQDCATTYKKLNRIRDESCSAKRPFYCYLEGSKKPSPSKLQFKRTHIASYSQLDPGCWLKWTGIRAISKCAYLCVSQGSLTDCIGFYWHPWRLECFILPYFDASVPLGFDTDEEKRKWRKYLRVL